MFNSRPFQRIVAGLGLIALTACGALNSGSIGSGGGGSSGSGSLGSLGGGGGESPADRDPRLQRRDNPAGEHTTIWDLFGNQEDPNVTIDVNKYIWNASLQVLNFLPIQAADPFSGVIVTGYGTPPGGGRSYRATIYITDPALDARSLNIAMQTRGGATVDADTIRAIEDAILTRARQLRIADDNL